MRYVDITDDKRTTYRLGENERVVFFLKNRGGALTFELAGAGAEAHIFALYDLNGDTEMETTITEIHSAPETRATFTGRALLTDDTSLDWRGLIAIRKNGAQTDAHQELRSLLLSPTARVSAIPSLEIETDDVTCGHSATVSAPDPEQLFSLASRGLSKSQATTLITTGFIADLYEKMETLAGRSADHQLAI